MEKKETHKASKPYWSVVDGYYAQDILRKGKLFGFIPFWFYKSTLKAGPHVENNVELLNNPALLEKKLKEGVQKLTKQP